MKKIYLCGFKQESNSFNPCLCEMSKFGNYCGLSSAEIIEKMRASIGSAVCGMLKVLDGAGYETVCGEDLRSVSYGPVDHSVVEYFIDRTVSELKNLEGLDGVLLSLHGATVSDRSEDVCGDIIEAVRAAVGESVVISASFDLHANITEKILLNSDYISGYNTYPHLDIETTGVRAAQRLVDHLEGHRPVVVASHIPMIAPAHGYTTYNGKLGELVSYANSLVENGKIVDYSLFEVQPWLDISNINSTVVVTAKSEEIATEVASDLARQNFALREELIGERLMEIDEVISEALNNKTGKPIVLVDSADSPNAGANADSAEVIARLLPYKDSLSAAVAVTDSAAVELAFKIGVGGVSDFTLGATIAPQLSKPVTVKGATVKSLHDGVFYRKGPQQKGAPCSLGKCAVLTVGRLMIHLSTRGSAEGDLNFYHSFGIDPTLCDLVAVKACTSFRAGYEPICAEIYNTNTPGAAGVVLTDMPYKKRPMPLYPFEEITEKDISEPKCYR